MCELCEYDDAEVAEDGDDVGCRVGDGIGRSVEAVGVHPDGAGLDSGVAPSTKLLFRDSK